MQTLTKAIQGREDELKEQIELKTPLEVEEWTRQNLGRKYSWFRIKQWYDSHIEVGEPLTLKNYPKPVSQTLSWLVDSLLESKSKVAELEAKLRVAQKHIDYMTEILNERERLETEEIYRLCRVCEV